MEKYEIIYFYAGHIRPTVEEFEAKSETEARKIAGELAKRAKIEHYNVNRK